MKKINFKSLIYSYGKFILGFGNDRKNEKEKFFHGNKFLSTNDGYDLLFRSSRFANVEVLYYFSEQDLLILSYEENIKVATDCNSYVFKEVLIDKIYTLPPIISDKTFSVFDVGMNRGYSALFFANMANCDMVYGFELDPNIYNKWILKNLELNDLLAKKIKSYNFGLWNNTEVVNIQSDGNDYQTRIRGIKNDNKGQFNTLREAKVKQASSVFTELFSLIEKTQLKVLKIDIEGAEYAVFEDLFNHGLLQQFDLIIGECHDGLLRLAPYLKDFELIQKDVQTEKRIGFCYLHNRFTSI